MNKVRQHNAIGLPFHGLATNGVLSTSGGNKTVSYSGGDVVMVKPPVTHTRPPARTAGQLADDADNGYTWQDYALLCGTNRTLSGSSTLGANHWLYCDNAGGTWVVEAIVSRDDPAEQFTVAVWLRELFGRIGGAALASIDRKLGELTFTPSVLSGSTNEINPDPAGMTDVSEFDQPMPKPDGKDALFNFCYEVTTATGTFIDQDGATVRKMGLSDVIQISITGNGSTAVATLGDGISATVSVYKTFSTIATDSSSQTDTYSTAPVFSCGVEGWWKRVLITDWSADLFYWYDADGNVAKASRDRYIYYELNVTHDGANPVYTLDRSHTESTVVGVHTLTYSWTSPQDSGSYHCLDGPQGTLSTQDNGWPADVYWIAAGASLVLMDGDGDANRTWRILGWNGGDTSTAFTGNAPEDLAITAEPEDGTVSYNFDGITTLCYV